MKAFLLFITILMLSLSTAYADDPESDDFDEYEIIEENFVNLFTNSVGVTYSNVSGYGLNYRVRFLDVYSIGISGMMHYKEKMKWETMSKEVVTLDEKDILYNFGIEIQRDIFTTNKTRLYVFLGGYLGTEKSNNFRGIPGSEGDEENKYYKVVGLGFGLQYYFSKYLAGNFHFAYKYDQLDTETNGSPGTEKATGVGFGIGLSVFF